MIEHKPFVPAEKSIPEFTPIPLVMGVLLGILFGASSLYLALKVGMTVSASIPVAVLSITLCKGLSKVCGVRSATILENNIVQTTGSAGESIAFGVAVTMPALLILGYDMELGRIMLVAVLGGLLGVLMMIPLRHALIVKEHHKLIYPEGTACAEVLMVGEKGGTSAGVFGGFFLGLFYKIANVGMKLWTDVPEKALGFFKARPSRPRSHPSSWAWATSSGLHRLHHGGGRHPVELGPHPRSLSETGLVPSSRQEDAHQPDEPARHLALHVLYIGAGAVAAGIIISLCQSRPHRTPRPWRA